MPTGVPLTLDDVHRQLWTLADRRGVIRLNQTDLAAALGVTKYTMSRKISSLLDEGRIRQVSRKSNARGTFVVNDPELWSANK